MAIRTADIPTVDAPCVRNCCLDEHDVCLGCGRHFDEIRQWHDLSVEQRRELLEVAAQRRQARPKPFR